MLENYIGNVLTVAAMLCCNSLFSKLLSVFVQSSRKPARLHV
jgi:hypothetical protein